MTIINEQIDNKLSLFSDADQAYIRSLMTYPLDLTPDETFAVLKIVRSLSANSTSATLAYFIELLEELYLKSKNPVVLVVYKGETPEISLNVPSGDNYTGSYLVIRREDTKEALSSLTTAGSSAAVQSIAFSDITLDAGTFIKILVTAEGDTDSAANGDVSAVLATMYLYVIGESESS